MYSMEALGHSVPSSSQDNRNYKSIYDRLRRKQPFTASLMSGRCAENLTVLRDIHLNTQDLLRLSALSVSASGHHPANPLTALHIHNLMIWDDDLLISDAAPLISSIAISMWCS